VANGSAVPIRRRLAVLALILGAASLAPATASAACPDRPMAREFARWLDPINYTLVPGGDFESGAAGWKLTGGARVVAGNEPFYLRGAGDNRSLYLPAGSSATSPFVCVELLDPVARFVSRNRGSLLGALTVEALIRTPLGTVTLPGGVDAVLSGWHPSLPVVVAGNLVSGLNLHDGTAEVAFRFRTTGLVAAWQLDDVFVDPFRSR
jgi:hypothetical protein